MDRLKKSRYAVKHSLKSMSGTAGRGGLTLVPINNSGGRLLLVGGNTPELICECETIPFPHFISECARRRAEDAAEATAHVSFPAEPPCL